MVQGGATSAARDAYETGAQPTLLGDRKVLFWTCANRPYADFAPLYMASVLFHVANSIVEIGVEDDSSFESDHRAAMAIVRASFPHRAFTKTVPWQREGRRILPNIIRFIEPPNQVAPFVYIGDIDIIVLERNLVEGHLAAMAQYGMPYSNRMRRRGGSLTGLHFTSWDAYYPLPDLTLKDIGGFSDEQVLWKIVSRKGANINTEVRYRPLGGIHVSPNREPLPHVNEGGWRSPGWSFARYLRQYRAFRDTALMQALRPTLSARIQGILTTLDGLTVRGDPGHVTAPIAPEAAENAEAKD